MYNFRRSPFQSNERHRYYPNKRRKNRVLCLYCHNTHTQDQMSEGVCPKMKGVASQLQNRFAYKCSNCDGEGRYERRLETKILQSAEKYQQRWKQWMEKAEEPDPNQKPPQRRVIKCEVKSTDEICSECSGHGQIKRLKTSSTSNLGDKQLVINPVWTKYHMQPKPSQQGFHCSICLIEGDSNEKNFQLSCKHQFHANCIFRWLKMNQKCPICRHVDPFIDLNQVQLPSDDIVEHSNQYSYDINIGANIFRQQFRGPPQMFVPASQINSDGLEYDYGEGHYTNVRDYRRYEQEDIREEASARQQRLSGFRPSFSRMNRPNMDEEY